ncbi:MAG: hypothetical protein QOJ72_1169 [Nocardioidaceae bacterium]|nr:hypothetical protein [Nocardioidaceae bacterium]
MNVSARLRGCLIAAAAALSSVAMSALPPTAADASPVQGTSCPTFPSDNYWHADVRHLAVDSHSATWMAHMSPTRNVHPDFGPSFGEQPAPYGIPITVVAAGHAKVPVDFLYDDESDTGPYPLGDDTLVEGGQYTSGDRHTIVVDKDACRLWETWATSRSGSSWSAGSGATWDLSSNALRPKGWTSADAAGLPILPGLLDYSEVEAGTVDHAIRFTTDQTDRTFIWPARHEAGSHSSSNYPPMGARFRLKSSYVIKSGLDPRTKVVLDAMKTYGLVLADNGSPWFFQGEADDRWPHAVIDQLKSVPASAFEAVDTAPLRASDSSMQVLVHTPSTILATVRYSSQHPGKAAVTVNGATTPTGVVAIYDGSHRIARHSLLDGAVTLTFGKLSHGTHKLKVVYEGSKSLWPDFTPWRTVHVVSASKTSHLS